MKSEKLLRAIGEIDDRFIEEADVPAVSKTGAKRNIRRFAQIAACAAVVVIAGILAVTGPLQRANEMSSSDRTSYEGPGYAMTSNAAEPVIASNTSAPIPADTASIPADTSASIPSSNTSAYPPSDAYAMNDGSEVDKTSKNIRTDSVPASSEGPVSDKDEKDFVIPGGILGNNSLLFRGMPGLIWQRWLLENRVN